MTRTLLPEAIAAAVRSLYTIGGVYDYLAEAVRHQGGLGLDNLPITPSRLADPGHMIIDRVTRQIFMHPLDIIAIQHPDPIDRIEAAGAWCLDQANKRFDRLAYNIENTAGVWALREAQRVLARKEAETTTTETPHNQGINELRTK